MMTHSNSRSGKATVEAINKELGTKFTYLRAASIKDGTHHFMQDNDWTVLTAKYIEEFRAQAEGFVAGRTFKKAPPAAKY